MLYQPITQVNMNTEMQKYYFLIRNSFSTFVKFFPSETSTSEGYKVLKQDSHVCHLCQGKSMVMSVGVKIATIPCGKNVPRAERIEVSNDIASITLQIYKEGIV